jgi:integrase
MRARGAGQWELRLRVGAKLVDMSLGPWDRARAGKRVDESDWSTCRATGHVPLHVAVAEAERRRALARAGADPRDSDASTDAKRYTVADAWARIEAGLYRKARRGKGQPLAPLTMKRYQQSWSTALESRWATSTFDEVTTSDVEAWLHSVAVGGVSRNGVAVGGPAAANRALALLSLLWNESLRLELTGAANRCQRVAPLLEGHDEAGRRAVRAKHVAQLKADGALTLPVRFDGENRIPGPLLRLWLERLDQLEARSLGRFTGSPNDEGPSLSPTYCDALRLLVWSDLRASECCGLRWSEVDLDERRVDLTTSKSERTRALSRQAVDVLRKVQARQAVEGALSAWVFPVRRSTGGEPHHIQRRRLQLSLERHGSCEGGPLHGFTLHSFRHSFLSARPTSADDPDLRRYVGGHATAKAAGVYRHPRWDEILAAIDATTQRIESSMQP